jgi:hypothetical protein
MKLSDQDHPRLPHRVRLRLKVVDERVQARANRIFDALHAQLPNHKERLRDIVMASSKETTFEGKARQMQALYRLVDEVSAIVKDNVACHKGCGHCCHMAVGISPLEAKMIGAAIDRQPKAPPMRAHYGDFDFGFHNPCTFLVNNECSIYEHRPLECRVFFSVDEDALLCHYGMSNPPKGFIVPQFDMRQYRDVSVLVSGTIASAEIRDFFPREEKKV